MVFLLLVAETTVNLISDSTLALLQWPDQLAHLREETRLVSQASAVEELLRYTSPIQIATGRYTTERLEYSGVSIPYGSMVLAVLASANRGKRQFLNPETLHLRRTPNPHLALGAGRTLLPGRPAGET